METLVMRAGRGLTALLCLLPLTLTSTWLEASDGSAHLSCRAMCRTRSGGEVLRLRGGEDGFAGLTDENRTLFTRAWKDNQFFALADSQASQKGEEDEFPVRLLTQEERKEKARLREKEPWFGAEDESSHLEEDDELMAQTILQEAGLQHVEEGLEGIECPPPPTVFEQQVFDSDEANAGNQLNYVSEDVYEGLRRDVEGWCNETMTTEDENEQEEEEEEQNAGAQQELEIIDSPPCSLGRRRSLWSRYIEHNVTVFNVSDAEGYAEAIREKKVVAPVTLTASASVLSAIFAKFVNEYQRQGARASRTEFSIVDNAITTILKGATQIGCGTRQQIVWSLGQIRKVLQVGFEVGATSGQVSARMRQRARQLRDTNVVRAKEMRLVEEVIKMMETYDTILPDTPYEDKEDE
ncbi:hypothetical protein GUITHDRAFT_153963 [Guillardia theta CCMP2712]|uniref:Transmembrane protein n=1 Tax=Guillardia theta (strain CCMP2712) TaxID=905079 RepID=L1IXJ3_GUITC|nr:hypothetical protein GUITHDRAFT_153963 [Guillardia theta CCMP2712]EKX40951.1 hypothetical protein GUITHDRAFT_153963 [Guillardia theta CCMP2712]|eukprot:XP_005827931.1 hypothetical protein GUITHDRAFT_153963 [Guillardia theta CCMP2712]